MQQQQTSQAPPTRIVSELKEAPGVLSCTFKHQVLATTVNFEWLGPKISPEVWNQVLAFFKWTYDTTHSESQVRLFLNRETQEWAAWAFPQKARTGMTAQELDNPQVAERLAAQRALFSPRDGWLYFGTVHHHCSAGAFQSSTDTANERDQDGIHITVGHMDKDWYDIDYRFYLKGYKLPSFDLADLWEVQTDYMAKWNELPVAIRPPIPDDIKTRLALYEMGRPAPNDTTFPEEWRANLVFDVPVVVRPSATASDIVGGHYRGSNTIYRAPLLERSKNDLDWDRRRALEEIANYVRVTEGMSYQEVLELLKEFDMLVSNTMLEIADILCRNDQTPAQIIKHIEAELARISEVEKDKAQTQTQTTQQISEGGPDSMTEDEMWAALHGPGTGAHSNS